MFFVSFQTTAYLLYLIKSVLSRTFFIFLKVFSIGFVRSVRRLKRDNSDILSCVVLFVNNFFILFWKIFQNHVARCKNMSSLAVSLTIIAPVSSSVNSFLRKFHFILKYHLQTSFIHIEMMLRSNSAYKIFEYTICPQHHCIEEFFTLKLHPSRPSRTSHRSGVSPLARSRCLSWIPSLPAAEYIR